MLRHIPIWLRYLPVLVLILLGDSLFIVNQTTQAIVLRFGEYRRIHTEPGLKIKIPFIEEVLFYETRILDHDLPPIELLTQDKKRLWVNTYTRYRISDPLKFFQSVTPASESGLHVRLEAIISSSVRNVLGKVELGTMLRKERSDNMHQILEEVRTIAEPLGIKIIDVRIIRAELPTENRNAVFARMNSELVRFAKESRAKGEEAAIGIRAKADKDKTIILAEANKKSEEIRGGGDAKAIEIAAEAFGVDPEFYEFYRTIESYRQSIKPGSSFLLSTNNEYTKHLTNCLPKK
jgi:membrane protease subunit HflC